MLLLRNSSISSSISSVMLKDWGSGAGGAAADGVGSDGFTEAMGLTSTAGFGLGSRQNMKMIQYVNQWHKVSINSC